MGAPGRVLSTLAATIGALALLVPAAVVTGAAPASAATTPVPNPEIADSCGLDVTLVLDASGSISSSHAVDDVRDAPSTFLDALSNTDSTARVTQFASLSQELAPRTLVDDTSMGQGGALSGATSRSRGWPSGSRTTPALR